MMEGQEDFLSVKYACDITKQAFSIAIFHNPDDYPGKYVARAFAGMTGTEAHKICNSLEEAHAVVLPGMVKFHRSENDNLSVVETWI